MNLLGAGELRSERLAFMATIRTLTDEQFELGRTLCAGWAPRDVLAHQIGTTELWRYAAHGLRVNAVNAIQVERARRLTRAELTELGDDWAGHPSLSHRLTARFMLGDVCVHHQDVLRGLDRDHEVPEFAATAIFREGVILSMGTSRNLMRYRAVPTTRGVRAIGRGQIVRGTAEALGLWLGGRKGIEDELEFESGVRHAAAGR